MYHGRTGKLICTTEQMLLHVDKTAQKAAPTQPEIYKALQAIMTAHKDMPKSDRVGRVMDVPNKGDGT